MGTKFSSGKARQVYEFKREHRRQYDVRRMCRVFEVNHSGYYARLKRPRSHRAAKHARLLKLTWASLSASNCVYGSPREVSRLARSRETCSKHRVARPMCEQETPRAKIPSKTEIRCQAVRAPSECSATTVRCRQNEQKLRYRHYQSPDLGRLTVPGFRHGPLFAEDVGWAAAPTSRGLAPVAILMPVRRRHRKKAIIHSDQGSPYGSDEWQCSAEPMG